MASSNGTMQKSSANLKAKGKKTEQKIKSQIDKHLKQGKSKLMWLEDKIMGEKSRLKIQAQLDKSKQKLNQIKKKFNEYEERAVEYTEKNPKKALAMATAAGILVGTVVSSFREKK